MRCFRSRRRSQIKSSVQCLVRQFLVHGEPKSVLPVAKSAPLGQQTVFQTGSRVNLANMFGSRSGSKTGPDISGRKSTVASQPSLKVTQSEAGPASSACRICKIIAINPKVQLEVKAVVPVQEPSPRATRRAESRTIQRRHVKFLKLKEVDPPLGGE